MSMTDSVVSAIKKTVPISMFNRGLAGKIFDDVKRNGSKVVMKNNTPEVVIVPTDEYVRDKEELEDLRLLLLATERMDHADPSAYISQEDIDKEFGFTAEDLADADEVEIE